jgi:DNA-binding ferritin-like protein
MAFADPGLREDLLSMVHTPSEGQQWLTQILAHLRAQHWNYWTTHWQVKGKAFYGDHLLFERLYGAELAIEIDTLAEKLVGYFGSESVTAAPQIQQAASWVSFWAEIQCPYQRGLKSEKDFQIIVAKAYDVLKGSAEMTLGLDDFLMAMANRHETNIYLLQQRISDPHHE